MAKNAQFEGILLIASILRGFVIQKRIYPAVHAKNQLDRPNTKRGGQDQDEKRKEIINTDKIRKLSFYGHVMRHPQVLQQVAFAHPGKNGGKV